MTISNQNDAIVLIGGKAEIKEFTFPNLTPLADIDMKYLMLETADVEIQFLKTAQYEPKHEWDILRLHAFGEGGDLLIRRDEKHVFWRFVGYEGIFAKLELSGKKYPYPLYYNKEEYEYSLLWGKYDEEDKKVKRTQRYEARMGKATLNYPNVPLAWERVEIRARRVVDTNEKIAAYWTYELAEHDPKKVAL